jgi:XTP/dITP diphosphohydrolase
VRPASILETILYAENIAAMRRFYEEVIGLECILETEGRQAFFRVGGQMLLIFNPRVTSAQTMGGQDLPPPHGAQGPGHVCFAAERDEIELWRDRLKSHDVAIETEFDWKRGGRSLYFRDPAGNSIEFAEPAIWGFARRSLRGAKLVVASHNPGKAREIAELLAPFKVEIVSAAALNLPEPEETGDSFAANAELKARMAAETAKLPAIADDSGLCVDALDGAPGIYSARWAGPKKDFSLAMREVENRLAAAGASTADKRRAHFVSALSVAWPDGHLETFEGRVEGTLVWPPRGGKGFGYDPMFVPAGFEQTFGEMEPALKHSLSHRARAFRKLVDALF